MSHCACGEQISLDIALKHFRRQFDAAGDDAGHGLWQDGVGRPPVVHVQVVALYDVLEAVRVPAVSAEDVESGAAEDGGRLALSARRRGGMRRHHRPLVELDVVWLGVEDVAPVAGVRVASAGQQPVAMRRHHMVATALVHRGAPLPGVGVGVVRQERVGEVVASAAARDVDAATAAAAAVRRRVPAAGVAEDGVGQDGDGGPRVGGEVVPLGAVERRPVVFSAGSHQVVRRLCDEHEVRARHRHRRHLQPAAVARVVPVHAARRVAAVARHRALPAHHVHEIADDRDAREVLAVGARSEHRELADVGVVGVVVGAARRDHVRAERVVEEAGAQHQQAAAVIAHTGERRHQRRLREQLHVVAERRLQHRLARRRLHQRLRVHFVHLVGVDQTEADEAQHACRDRLPVPPVLLPPATLLPLQPAQRRTEHVEFGRGAKTVVAQQRAQQRPRDRVEVRLQRHGHEVQQDEVHRVGAAGAQLVQLSQAQEAQAVLNRYL